MPSQKLRPVQKSAPGLQGTGILFIMLIKPCWLILLIQMLQTSNHGFHEFTDLIFFVLFSIS